jgi:hypothetical protein
LTKEDLKMNLADEIAEVENLLDRIRNNTDPKIDGRVLSTAVDLIYRCGLEQKEIPEVTIGSLNRNDNGELSEIRLSKPDGETSIPIPDEVRDMLEDYLSYLDSHPKYKTDPESLLFPKYWTKRTFARHLDDLKLALNIHDLHRIGLKRHYELLRNQGIGEKEALEATAKQYRTTLENVGDRIQGKKIKPAGAQPRDTEYGKVLKNIDNFVVAKSVDDAREIHARISRLIEEGNFSAEEKDSFKEAADTRLSDRIKKLEEKASQPEIDEPSMPLADLYRGGPELWKSLGLQEETDEPCEKLDEPVKESTPSIEE